MAEMAVYIVLVLLVAIAHEINSRPRPRLATAIALAVISAHHRNIEPLRRRWVARAGHRFLDLAAVLGTS
jgi:hypothetical protein